LDSLNLSGFVGQPVTLTLRERYSENVIDGAIPAQVKRAVQPGDPANNVDEYQ
jgi:hypothetical protein